MRTRAEGAAKRVDLSARWAGYGARDAARQRPGSATAQGGPRVPRLGRRVEQRADDAAGCAQGAGMTAPATQSRQSALKCASLGALGGALIRRMKLLSAILRNLISRKMKRPIASISVGVAWGPPISRWATTRPCGGGWITRGWSAAGPTASGYAKLRPFPVTPLKDTSSPGVTLGTLLAQTASNRFRLCDRRRHVKLRYAAARASPRRSAPRPGPAPARRSRPHDSGRPRPAEHRRPVPRTGTRGRGQGAAACSSPAPAADDRAAENGNAHGLRDARTARARGARSPPDTRDHEPHRDTKSTAPHPPGTTGCRCAVGP